MSEQPALKDDAVASSVVTIRDLVKAERERDEALRLHVEDHARIDALLIERGEALAALGRVRALAEDWRYKGEFGWGAWQEGHGPDQEGWVLDHAAGEIRTALDGPS